MWYCEAERLGMKKCTLLGYILRSTAPLVLVATVITLLYAPLFMIMEAIRGRFEWEMSVLFLCPLFFAATYMLMPVVSSMLLKRREFEFDYETRIASWIDKSGEQRTYSE
ncbi:hypothetical protein N8590_03050 [bacterium]|jgi:hypothetical protein|nr:hypothetical protein [bacterium]